MITKKQVDDLAPKPFEQKMSVSRYRDGSPVPSNLKVWGQDEEGNWFWKEHAPRIKKGKFERGFYPITKKNKDK